MADPRRQPKARGPIASRFDVMTLAIAVIMLCVTACSVLALGPIEAMNRVGSGLTGLVDGFTP